MLNKIIKSVQITLNPTKVEEAPPIVKENMHVNFTSNCSLSEEDRTKLRTVFMFVNRARALAIKRMQKFPESSTEVLRSYVFNNLTTKEIDHTLKILISNECYYIRRNFRAGKTDIQLETLTISFNELNTTNNRFVINHRRDKILIEDFNVILHTKDPIPNFKEGERFYLNVCVSDLDKLESVYINMNYVTEITVM